MPESTPYDLKSFITHEIIKKVDKIKGKHSPISEVVDGISKTLLVQNVYDLSKKEKNFFLLIVKNYSKKPKLRYLIAILLANSSSDLLVQFAKDYAIKSDLKLIQYSLYPKTLRIPLLLLKEIKRVEDYSNSIDKLKSYRKKFHQKLVRLKKLVENE